MRNYMSLIQNMAEMSALLAGSTDIQMCLEKMVKMVAEHLRSDVCSIYLLEPDQTDLRLRATVGLNQGAIGSVRLKPGEGLVGQTLKDLKPIILKKASSHKAYRYFPELNEDKYESFLSVPIVQGAEKIGVLVVQRKESNAFLEDDVFTLNALSTQLAGAIENIRVLLEVGSGISLLQHHPVEKKKKTVVRGKSASEGFAVGNAFVWSRSYESAMKNASSGRKYELSYTDFEKAVNRSIAQIQHIESKIIEQIPEAASLIFSAHILMLKDEQFVGQMKQRIKKGVPVLKAVRDLADYYRMMFSRSNSRMIQEKVNDLEDVTLRLLYNLQTDFDAAHDYLENRIVIASTLYPSDIVQFVVENVAGIVLLDGGVTTHVSILARSLGLPMIIADKEDLPDISNKSELLLDADIGNLYVDPEEDVRKTFSKKQHLHDFVQQSQAGVSSETRSSDGKSIHLLSNINLLSEIELAIQLKSEGVGLYRSEFPFLIRTHMPTEEDQISIYKMLAGKMNGREVIIRTLDVGGEKLLKSLDENDELNPQLGLRSIRFSLKYRDIFETQIRAILRAGAEYPNLKIMFPMISSLDELQKARYIVQACMRMLDEDGKEYNKNPEIGIMIELPALVEVIDDLVYEADFFSIGTNDFIQYMLAVDRGNEKVSSYYCPHHPAVLRALKRVARAVTSAQKPLSVCGEMAHERKYLPFLIGIGINRFSVDPRFVPELQQHISSLDAGKCEQQAENLMSISSLRAVEQFLDNQMISTSDSRVDAY